MGLGEDLRLLSEQVRKRQAYIKGEEATKQALILPFIQALGYDIYDPTETQPEYVADFARKRGGVMEKVVLIPYEEAARRRSSASVNGGGSTSESSSGA